MKKKTAISMIGLCALLVFAGCQNKTANQGQGEKNESAGRQEYQASDYVALGEYTGMELSLEKAEVTEEDIKNYVETTLATYPAYETLDKTVVENGDSVNIDYEGLLDGEAFSGGTAANQVLEIGSHSFIDGFEEGLIGAKVGDEVSLDLTFPDPYQNDPDMSGKAVVFKVKVNSIVQKLDMTYETLTDEYVSSNFGQATVQDFKNDVKETLESNNAYMEESNKHSAAITKLQEICTVENLPQELLDERVNEYISQFEESCEMQGIKVSEYLEQYQTTEEEFRTQAVESVKSNLEFEMILLAIAEKENIELDEEGYQEYVKNMLAYYGYETEEALYERYGEEDVKNTYVGYKALDYVIEHANVTYTNEASQSAPEEADNQ